jgi:hypothetical protein
MLLRVLTGWDGCPYLEERLIARRRRSGREGELAADVFVAEDFGTDRVEVEAFPFLDNTMPVAGMQGRVHGMRS